MTLLAPAMVHQAREEDFPAVLEGLEEDHQIPLAALVVAILSKVLHDTTHGFFR